MRNRIFILLFFFIPIYQCIGQQVKLDGIDVSQVIVNDTLAVHTFIDLMNKESTTHHIKSITEFKKRKIFKPKIESKKSYSTDGKIYFKVDYRWKGGDSSRVYYRYDSLGRLIEALNYNSIYGKDDEGSFIRIQYDELDRVQKCETKYRVTSFGYNSDGSKDCVEFVRYNYRYSNRRKKESYLADSSTAKYFYRYNPHGKLSCIVNSKKDSTVKFKYNELNQLIEKNSFNIWSNRYRYYNDGRVKDEDFLEHNNNEQDTTLNETCHYYYENDLLIKTECTIHDGFGENSIYEYKYNEKGLLSELIKINKKVKIAKHIIYRYEYY